VTAVDVWSKREQIFLAALDTHETETCENLLGELKSQFPESQRVSRLEGLLHEVHGDTIKANRVYDKMAETNPSNSLCMKRKICLLKAAGKMSEATNQLCEYLSISPSDVEAWKELAQIYLEYGNFKQAAFCLEEVLLAHPHSYLSFLVYAECLYSIGSKSALSTAQKYFSHSLVLKKTSRALWGLALTSKALKQDQEISNVCVQTLLADNKGDIIVTNAINKI